MASFQAKIGWKRQKREKIKIIVPFYFYPTGLRKFLKKQQKIQKIKKYHYGIISSQNRLEKAEREKTKIIVSFRSNPTLNRKLQKNSKKIKKYHSGFISGQNLLENAEKQRK